jgi:hypothetical protein
MDGWRVDHFDAGEGSKGIDAGDVQSLAVPQIVVPQQKSELELALRKMSVEYLEGSLVCEDIYLLAVVEEVSEKDEIANLPAFGRPKDPIKNLQAVIQPFGGLLVGMYVQIAEYYYFHEVVGAEERQYTGRI